jgi:hypothetical protein
MERPFVLHSLVRIWFEKLIFHIIIFVNVDDIQDLYSEFISKRFKGTVSRDFRPSVIFIKTTSKSENHMQNSDGMQKILKMHVVSMIPHARCMRYHWHRMHGAYGVIDTACKIWHRMHDRRKLRMALAAFKGNIYKKTYMFPNCPTPPLNKFINLKGLPNNNFSCIWCHWHRMHDFCVRKSIISRRNWSRIQKGFSPWIRGPGGIVW